MDQSKSHSRPHGEIASVTPTPDLGGGLPAAPGGRHAVRHTPEPVGEVLRSAFRADNHDSLSPDITRLLLELSTVGGEGPPERPIERTQARDAERTNVDRAANARQPPQMHHSTGGRSAGTMLALLILSGLAMAMLFVTI